MKYGFWQNPSETFLVINWQESSSPWHGIGSYAVKYTCFSQPLYSVGSHQYLDFPPFIFISGFPRHVSVGCIDIYYAAAKSFLQCIQSSASQSFVENSNS